MSTCVREFTVHMPHILYKLSLLPAGVIIKLAVLKQLVRSIFRRFFLWFCQNSDLMTRRKLNE